jgi:hypothetical protein
MGFVMEMAQAWNSRVMREDHAGHPLLVSEIKENRWFSVMA